MDIGGSDIFAQMDRLRRRLDNLASDVQSALFALDDEASWRPPVDIAEEEDALVVTADLPGVNKEEIDLRVDGFTLTISGERRAAPTDGRPLRRERPMGRFHRSFRLEVPVEASAVKATYRNGVLEVRLPKAGPSRPVRPEIESE